ncbi:MAG TPA: glycine betaine ABC transporter substrate-binding protein [Atopostipes sp.]|nr:glycine betaine ABC transporter substrate-binding protein [Atopostipes sp.]
MILVACGSNDETIQVGSKDFTESLLVSEIYALALEDNGYEVERIQSIASSVIPQSLESGEIDLYPEYTGTSLMTIFNLPLQTDPDAVAGTIREEYEAIGLTTLDYAPANNAQGIAIRTDVAEELGIATISDFQANAGEIRFASQGEFDLREDGLVGLAEVYGEFNFADSTVYDNSLKYQILRSDEADATPAYTTDGQLVNTDEFLVLEDDKNFWPPYNLVPVINQEVLEANSDLADILNAINADLTTEQVIELNAAVDIDGREYEEVAAEYYESLN